MSVLVVVQARMGSTRLPGKVMAGLRGRPMLQFMLERLAPLQTMVEHRVVATTTSPNDDPIADVAASAGWEVVRGDEFDVLGRFSLCMERFPTDDVVRLTADCPLADPAIVRDVVELHARRQADYTCNVLPRTFPKGLDVEIARSDALHVAHAESTDPSEREHVTPFLYRRPERFRLANLRSGRDLGQVSWTVDCAEDLERVREILNSVDDDAAPWREIASAYRPMAPPAGLRLRPATMDDAASLLAWRNDDVTVRFSTSRRPVKLDEHLQWLSSCLEDPGCKLYILEAESDAAGSVRVDVRNAIGTVSIALDQRFRGRGLGTKALRLLQDTISQDQQVLALDAIIDSQNFASLRAFRAAGFVPVANEEASHSRMRWTSPRR